MIRISIGVAGTITGLAAETPDGLTSLKVLTSPPAPEAAARGGVDRLLAGKRLTPQTPGGGRLAMGHNGHGANPVGYLVTA